VGCNYSVPSLTCRFVFQRCAAGPDDRAAEWTIAGPLAATSQNDP
jgi:hypothetical protein